MYDCVCMCTVYAHCVCMMYVLYFCVKKTLYHRGIHTSIHFVYSCYTFTMG